MQTADASAAITTANIENFRADMQKISDDHYAAEYPKLTPPLFVVKKGRKYAKVCEADAETGGKNHMSVVAFIDMKNGDVLRAAGWAAPSQPSRGRRGNVNQNDYQQYLTPYGPAYL